MDIQLNIASSNNAPKPKPDSAALPAINSGSAPTPAAAETAKNAAAVVTQQQSATAEQTKQVEAAVRDINQFVQNIQRDILFSVSEVSGRTIIQVYDTKTEELIRQIPSEQIERIAESLKQQTGGEGLLFEVNI